MSGGVYVHFISYVFHDNKYAEIDKIYGVKMCTVKNYYRVSRAKNMFVLF